MNDQTQYQLIKKIQQDAGINIVTCGNCGRVILHVRNISSLLCGDCGFNSDISDFPDFIYEEINENHTQPVINFTRDESDTNKYTFSYQCTKKCELIEVEGTMQPYYSGRAIEHNMEWGFTNEAFSEIVETEEGLAYKDTISCTVEEEVYTAFYNHFTK